MADKPVRSQSEDRKAEAPKPKPLAFAVSSPVPVAFDAPTDRRNIWLKERGL